MIDRDILLILIGAGIALVSSLATALLQHVLSLRAEIKKREWEVKQKREEELRESLLPGSHTIIMENDRLGEALMVRAIDEQEKEEQKPDPKKP